MKPKWLSRNLVVGPHLVLVTSEVQFRQVLKSLKSKIVTRWIGSRAIATTTMFDAPNGKSVCIVSLNPDKLEDMDPIDVATVLVHEAVHVFQQHCKDMGEEHPSEEFEAYSIQHISQQLMVAYRDNPARPKI